MCYVNEFNVCCNHPFERKNILTNEIYCFNCNQTFLPIKIIKCKYCKFNNHFKNNINKQKFKCKICGIFTKFQNYKYYKLKIIFKKKN